jgi:hypothetical protein
MSDELIRSAEEAGLYIESHQGSVAKTDSVLFCSACKKDLREIPKGDMLFTQTHGRCSCSWSCCEVAKPSNSAHARHLSYRPKT